MSRIDKIAQNGNDGLHYEETDMCDGNCKRDVLGLKDNVASSIVAEAAIKRNEEWAELAGDIDKDLYKYIDPTGNIHSTTASAILRDASELIDQRGEERDQPDGERSMARAVYSFNAMTEHSLSEEEGWKFMLFLKLARMEGGRFKMDDYEDAVAYSALMAEAAVKEK